MFIKEKDIRFKAVRASGPGGQRTSRRSTKVQARLKINDLPLSDLEKRRIREKLAHRINQRDELWVESEEERFQKLNKDRAFEKLNDIVKRALRKAPPRIPTKPPRNVEEIRIRAKKIRSQKKAGRRHPAIG